MENIHEQREYFDLYEANALIPKLEYYFGELARLQRGVNRLAKEAEKLGVELTADEKPKLTGNLGVDIFRRKCSTLAREYADIMDEIHSLGVIVEDPDLGVVNFYSLIEGDEVILSWQYGEAEVTHWYRANEDFMARRPLQDVSEGTSTPPVH
jgi:hypothetical protein